MVTRAEEHAKTGRDMLSRAQEFLTQGDLLQASEKGWGAAAHMVKGVAERRGWPYTGHWEMYLAVNRLAQETGDGSLRTMFHVAGSLYGNYYENWMPTELVENGLEQMSAFVDSLKGLL